MSFHHLSLATRDLEATHRFYTEAMNFELVCVEGASSGEGDGWLRHALYDVGDGEVLAFMELHDERWTDFDPAISRGLGLPEFVNHFAFDAADEAALDTARDRWLAFGLDVVRMGHSHGTSIYAVDPNGNMVEWAWTTRPFDRADRLAAAGRLRAVDLTRDAPIDMEFFLAADHVPLRTPQ